MAPASLNHTIIKGTVFAALRSALAGTSCQVFTDGTQITTDEISVIPDVVVTCAPLDHSTPAIAEPAIIVEVMSPSSEAEDTLRKWFSYRGIASLKHYLVLAQDRRVVQILARAFRERGHDRARRPAASARARRPVRGDRFRCLARSDRSGSPLQSDRLVARKQIAPCFLPTWEKSRCRKARRIRSRS
jgi:hypothetical protein